MGEEEKKEQENLIALNADPVEAVALTYDSECIPVKYQKIGGDAHTPHRGSAQAVGYDVYLAVNEEISPPEKTVHSRATSSQNRKPFGRHPWRTDGYQQ